MKILKISLVFIMAVLIVVSGGCASSMVKSGNLNDFVYCVNEDEYPRIYLIDDGTFLMSFDVMDNMLIEGTYSMPDKSTAKLTAYDGSEYFFNLDKKNRCLIFDGEKSDSFPDIYSDIFEISDGTVFNVWE